MDRNMLIHKVSAKNAYRQMKKKKKKNTTKKMQWIIENIIMIIIKHLEINKILALNNQQAIDVPLTLN